MQSHRLYSNHGAEFSGRSFREAQQSSIFALIRSSKRQEKRHQCHASSNGGFGGAVKNFARKVQSGLPIVGLLSRLATDTGGIGNDEMAYPEFARKVMNLSDVDFNEAVKAWSEKFGQVGQRKYVILFLWMARTGLGFVPNKKIVLAASRLRVTQDIEIEVERFELARKEALEMYSYDDRPKGRTKQQILAAVDSLCRLSIGLKDGESIPEDDKQLLSKIISGAFRDLDEPIQTIVEEAVSDSSRAERKNANQ